ncbi:hypothetical protein EG329_008920 [Mollisiaceae sp. DMI_Dod_QoI]|nr:hypothetical protein EG329_008920 [Helotiales sp. DMI_Dod_QoI]
MNSYKELSEESETYLLPLARTQCTTDFSRLLSGRRASRASGNRLSVASSRRSKSNNSENSQILYMSAPENSKKRSEIGRSLSSISNGTGRRFDGSADEKLEDPESLENKMSRNIINREIFEWQSVCQSGRPYWWSSESKYARLKKLQHRSGREHDLPIWTHEVEDAPIPHYDLRRRAVSDSYLADPSAVHDLAHFIAVQLLGACFTLPPDIITAVSPEYKRDEDGFATVQDPRLISSLRMHTHFRYSPSFGHQARNTSPVQHWPGRYDGTNPGSSSIRSNTDTSTPCIGTSNLCSRRPRSQRPPHNTEGSPYEDDRDDDEDYIQTCYNNRDLNPTGGATAGQRRRGIHDEDRPAIILPRMPGAGTKRRPTHDPECSIEEEDVSGRIAGPSAPSTPKSNYRLQAVIRSEPHHVFIQPVRELVVKRWRKFRRRLSGSLHSSLPTRASDEQTSASESDASEDSSAVLSNDAKVRRLRAQERGDIHSSSVDSTPHYNTPGSGQLSPNGNGIPTPHWIDPRNLTPTFGRGDPLAAAASLVAAEMSHLTSSGTSTSGALTPSDGISRGYTHSAATSALVAGGTSYASSEILSPSPLYKHNTPSSTYSFSPKRLTPRQRRRSMLSEVCTPEDFHPSKSSDVEGSKRPFDRSILSAAGSTLASPKEETPPAYPSGAKRVQDVLSSPGPSVLPTLAELRAFSAQERPRMSRTSTNGTQIFTPSDDGVEVDGLPVGPSKETWAGKGGRRERTYL